MLGWQRDWAAEDSYDTVMDIVKSRRRAYGVGVEYADTDTLVYGALQTKLPEYVVRASAIE
jgi:hypothetical protein